MKKAKDELNRVLGADQRWQVSLQTIEKFLDLGKKESFSYEELESIVNDKFSDKNEKLAFLSILAQQDYVNVRQREKISLLMEAIKSDLHDLEDEVMEKYWDIKYISGKSLNKYESKKFDKEQDVLVTILSWYVDSKTKSLLNDVNLFWVINLIKDHHEELTKAVAKWENMKDFWLSKWYSDEWWIFDDNELKVMNELLSLYNSNKDFHSKLDQLVWYTDKLINIKDIENWKNLISSLSVKDSFAYLCDFDNSWEITQDDKGKVNGIQLFDLLNDLEVQFNATWKPNSELYENISAILNSWWIDCSLRSNQDLFNLLKTIPESKYVFIKQLTTFVSMWIDADYIIRNGKDSFKSWMDTKDKLLSDTMFGKYWQMIYTKTIDQVDKQIKDWKTQVDKWEIKNSRFIQAIKYMDDKIHRKSFLESIKDQVMTQWVSAFLSFLWTSMGWASYASLRLSKKHYSLFEEQAKSFTDNLDISLDFINTTNREMMALWFRYRGTEKIWKKWYMIRWIWSRVGFSNDENWLVMPNVELWYWELINYEELMNAWLRWFEQTSKKVELIWKLISYDKLTFAPRIDLEFWEDRWEAVQSKTVQYRNLINSVFNIGDDIPSSSELITKLRTRLNSNKILDENNIKDDGIKEQAKALMTSQTRDYIELMLKNIKLTLDIYGYDKLSNNQKKEIITWIKNIYVSNWAEFHYRRIEDEWMEVNKVSIWIMRIWFLASIWVLSAVFPLWWFSFMFMPWFWVDEVEVNYEEDAGTDLFHELSMFTWIWMSKKDLWWKLSWFSDKLQGYMNVKWLDIVAVDGKIKITPPKWRKLYEMMNIYIEPSKLSQVRYDWESLYIWNVERLWYNNIRWKEWQEHNFIIWAKKDPTSDESFWTYWALLMNKDILNLTQDNEIDDIYKIESSTEKTELSPVIKWLETLDVTDFAKYIDKNVERIRSWKIKYKDLFNEYKSLLLKKDVRWAISKLYAIMINDAGESVRTKEEQRRKWYNDTFEKYSKALMSWDVLQRIAMVQENIRRDVKARQDPIDRELLKVSYCLFLYAQNIVRYEQSIFEMEWDDLDEVWPWNENKAVDSIGKLWNIVWRINNILFDEDKSKLSKSDRKKAFFDSISKYEDIDLDEFKKLWINLVEKEKGLENVIHDRFQSIVWFEYSNDLFKIVSIKSSNIDWMDYVKFINKKNKIAITDKILSSWVQYNMVRSITDMVKKLSNKYPELKNIELDVEDIRGLIINWELGVWNNRRIKLDREFIFFINWDKMRETVWLKLNSLQIEWLKFEVEFKSDWRVVPSTIDVEGDEKGLIAG